MGGEQAPHWVGKRHHPLTHRHPGNDMIDEMGGRFRHASGATGGAKASLFIGERHQFFMGAFSAPLGPTWASPRQFPVRLGQKRSPRILERAGTASSLRPVGVRRVHAHHLAYSWIVVPGAAVIIFMRGSLSMGCYANQDSLCSW